jgi:hypothetical protein
MRLAFPRQERVRPGPAIEFGEGPHCGDARAVVVDEALRAVGDQPTGRSAPWVSRRGLTHHVYRGVDRVCATARDRVPYPPRRSRLCRLASPSSHRRVSRSPVWRRVPPRVSGNFVIRYAAVRAIACPGHRPRGGCGDRSAVRGGGARNTENNRRRRRWSPIGPISRSTRPGRLTFSIGGSAARHTAAYGWRRDGPGGAPGPSPCAGRAGIAGHGTRSMPK